MTFRNVRTEVPEIVSGSPLDDIWEVVAPVGRTNEILNPSFETNTTGYTAGAGTLTRSLEKQYHGAYSGKYVPSVALTDGFFYGTITTLVGQIRALSIKFWGQPNVPYALTIATTGGVDLAVYPFKGTGRWQWIVLYYTETAATTRRLYFRKNGSTNIGAYYVDGVQSELINAGETVSTYIDGDQQGFLPNQQPLPYYWTGTPHASTSVRSGLTRSGGSVVKLSRYGWLLMAMIGLGMAPAQNVASEYAVQDGGYPTYTRKTTRQFTLSGVMYASTYPRLRMQKGEMGAILDRDAGGIDQSLLLRHYLDDGCGNLISDVTTFQCKYMSGLEGNTNNPNASPVPLTFIQYVPTVMAEGTAGGSLNVQSTVSNANNIIQRSPTGVWSSMGTGAAITGVVECIFVSRSGLVYAGGSFTGMGGVANTTRIAVWNPTTQTWAALGTGITGAATSVFAITEDASGNIYAGGTFTGAGGVANTSQLAKWNGAAWVSITPTVANNSVLAIAFDNVGNLYAGGSFTTINGVAAVGIAKFDGTTWTALAAGPTGVSINSLLFDRAWNLYVGGTYTFTSTNIAKYVPSTNTWVALGVGLTGGAVRGIAFDDGGNLYVGGQFTASGAVTLTKLARWTGSGWFPLSTGTAGGTNAVSEMTWNGIQHLLYIGGVFTSAGGISTPDSAVTWNGGGFGFLDVDLPGTAQVNAIQFGVDGTMYVGFDSGLVPPQSAITGSTTTVNNPGSAETYPTIKLYGPPSGAAVRMWNLSNTSTLKNIFFNLFLNVGEIATLVFTPDHLQFTSNIQGDISSLILPGSSEAEFYLKPGDNTLSMLSAGSTVTATYEFRPAYVNLEDVP